MRWRHVKSGGIYEIIGYGKIEADLTPCVIYRAKGNQQLWVRPKTEFFDGRFVAVADDAPEGM